MDDPASPFHAGERELQQRIGARERVERSGRRLVRDYLPDEHREFYARLSLLFLGSIDGAGRPWASVLFGRPGFVISPDPRSLEVTARPIFADPLNDNLTPDARLGLLGIDFSTRRRNRLNGTLSHVEPGRLRIEATQTYGNCPQYIQARDDVLISDIDRIAAPRSVQRFRQLGARARDIVARSDTLFIASHLPGAGDVAGADVSHRGGKPGFVRVDGDSVLTLPDFPGNRYFNTLGNILLNPRAALLFIDFGSGDLLSLTCKAEIIWDGDEVRAFKGADRLLRLSLDEGILWEHIVPIQWRFTGWSHSLQRTGSWQEDLSTPVFASRSRD